MSLEDVAARLHRGSDDPARLADRPAQAPGASAAHDAERDAVGILLFLLWDVLSAAWEPIDTALSDFHAGDGGLGRAFGYGLLFTAGIAVGLLALVGYERWMDRVTHRPGATLVEDPDLDADPPSAAMTSGARVVVAGADNSPC